MTDNKDTKSVTMDEYEDEVRRKIVRTKLKTIKEDIKKDGYSLKDMIYNKVITYVEQKLNKDEYFEDFTVEEFVGNNSENASYIADLLISMAHDGAVKNI